ncbi:RteC domain-containing protein [Winogradskyella forsetii]|uniref:RteC domain-containing protein n=1 Tax=Winogradskyella forsetii TaxID=2686077 RepID=UPI001E59AF87|nr:RteC domain-containing protein [Winogradskyella forsetii]
MNFTNKINNLNEQLNFINLEIDDPIEQCEKAIGIIVTAVESLKNQISKRKFKSQVEEIKFFKEIKPQFTSKLIYYNKIYKIETKKPRGGRRIVKKYYREELQKLKRFFDYELEFYKYYRTGSAYLDYKYFVRGNFDIKLSLDSLYFESDLTFATLHSYKVAKIKANDLLEVFIENKLQETNNSYRQKSQHKPNSGLIWTGSKVSLIELLYALHSEGVFNNGAVDLKDIALYFESVFNVNLGQYRRTFLEIRMRKSNRTKFINSLKKILLKRMDDADY